MILSNHRPQWILPIFDLMTLYCARLWDNFHQVWSSTTDHCLNYNVFDADMFCHAVTMTFNFLTLNFYSMCHVFKFCTKSERNRIIHRWVIDDLARFRCAILGDAAQLPNGSQWCVDPTLPNLVRTWLGRSPIRCIFILVFRHLVVFSNSGGSKLSDVENDAKFCTFYTTVKNRGGVGKIFGPINEALPTLEPPEYIW